MGDYIDDLGPDDVVVLDNQGRVDTTVWGDLLTTIAHRRNVAGTVIDGVCRDVDRASSLGYPVFSRGNWMRTGKDRVRVEATQVPVSIGGIRVEPGDHLVRRRRRRSSCPAARVAEVLATAEEIELAENTIRDGRRGGRIASRRPPRRRLPRPAASRGAWTSRRTRRTS